jgi:hypothetical protein
MNSKYSQDIDKTINNDFFIEIIIVVQTLLSSNNPQFAASTVLQTFGILVVSLLK